mmetsp:Transcript_9068/g.25334  ORF Transcript_9068/g.25334 Transcript_9068/m.25334 type:complete len:475 (-) Transcript_9068:140-1564(-)
MTEVTDVIWDEVHKGKEGEGQRAALVFLTLWDVKHGTDVVFNLPNDTLYTASIVMPMIARSSGYKLTFTAIAVKMVVLNLVCIALQLGLISSFNHARVVLPALDGAPNICTYGQDTGNTYTPHGPLGIKLERNRRNIETDFTMVMVRNTLHEVMKRVNVTNDIIGPVDLGMESATCRLVCIGVFCIAILAEVFTMIDLARFLWYVPAEGPAPRAEEGLLEASPETKECHKATKRWVTFSSDAKSKVMRESWHLTGRNNLDSVRFKASAMPWSWKVVVSLLLMAHCTVITLTFWNGLAFLMNTGAILDLVLNTLSLTFILELDNLLFFTLARGVTKEILKRIEPLSLHEHTPNQLRTQLTEKQKREQDYGKCQLLLAFIIQNWATVSLVSATIAGHYVYFFLKCTNKHGPFMMTNFLGESYFHGATHFFGGWELLLGAWYSKNVSVDDAITCAPYNSLSKHSASGCGLPSPWSER